MVEIEIGVLAGQCLDRRIDSYARLMAETAAWEKRRNAERARINWMFTTEKARAKMGRAYPNGGQRNVVDYSAIDQHSAIIRKHGRQNCRDGAGGAHGLPERSAANEIQALTGTIDVCCDGEVAMKALKLGPNLSTSSQRI